MRKWGIFKILNFLLFGLSIIYLSGCATGVTTTNVQTTEQNINEAVKYQGPKARIAVANFKCKAAKCNGRIGAGIRDMLVDALVRTGKFVVLERGEGLEAIKSELELGQSGLVQPGKAPQPGLLEGADILVVGSIVAFEPNAGGIKGGLGGLLPKVPILGGIKLGKEDAYIALTLRLIDVRTGRIINSTRVEGKASSFSVGGLGGGLLGTIALGGGLEVYKNTPMEKAVMVLLDNAVKAIEKYVPESYYRYKGSQAPSQTKPVAVATAHTQTAVSTQKPPGKLVFSENFESYGVGQAAPFGRWKGKNASIVQVVQRNGQIGKAVLLKSDASLCISNLKLKNFIMDLDFDATHWSELSIKFRVQENPYVAYRLKHNEFDDKLTLYKDAGTMSVKIAENKGRFKEVNKWEHLKLVVKDNSIKVYANQDNIVIDIKDNDASLSKAGSICIYQHPGAGDNTKIDNIKIYRLD